MLLLVIAGLLPMNGHAHSEAASGTGDAASIEWAADAPTGEHECHGGTPHAGCAGATAIISGDPVPRPVRAFPGLHAPATRERCSDPMVDGPWRPPTASRS